MATIAVTEQEFENAVKSGIVLLDLWAEWCGPCRAFAPIFEAASERHPDVTFGKIDTEAEGALAEMFGVQAIPTLVVMRDGIVLGVQPGLMPAEGLDDFIARAKALDMDVVRAKVAEQREQTPPA